MWRYIRNSWRELVGFFMAGLLAVLPLVLTIAIVVWVTSFLRDLFGPNTFLGGLLASVGMRFGFEGAFGYLIGIALVVLSLLGIGLLLKWGAKKIIQGLVDTLLKRLPIVGNLYGSLKQLVSMFDRTDETKLKAMSVVFCYFGGTGGTGVLALMPSPEIISIDGQDYHVVIIPTAPIPFGGGLIFIPTHLVKPVEMSVDHFIGIYVSMGVTTAEFMPTINQTSIQSN
ncbi:MAG TPA: DUF502 domain-containing protein [Pirellulaceae bacterium]|nr:DUF502 domain-containing protein [Pirellulaceae bacterium]